MRKTNNAGTINKVSDQAHRLKPYKAMYPVGRYPNGRLKKESQFFATWKEAHQWTEAMEKKSKDGKLVEKADATIYDIAKFQLDEKLSLGIIKESTYVDKNMINNAILRSNIGHMSVTNVTVQDINNVFAYLTTRYSQGYITNVYIAIKHALEYAYSHGMIGEDIGKDLKKAKSKKQSKDKVGLTLEQQLTLHNYLIEHKSIYSNVLLLAMHTGMRVGEVCALRRKDIDLENKTISITKTISKDKNNKTVMGNSTKTGKSRVLHITDIAVSVLSEAIKGKKTNDLLFLNSNNDIINISNLYSIFVKICKKAGVYEPGMSPHSLRHTYVSRRIESGADIYTISKEVGHSNINTTVNIYADYFDEYARKNMTQASSYMAEQGFKI